MLRLYAIYDRVSGIFMPPFTARTDGIVIRDLTAAVADKSTSLGKFPSDYDCYLVGAFDDLNGEIKSYDRDLVCKCADLVIDRKLGKDLGECTSDDINVLREHLR